MATDFEGITGRAAFDEKPLQIFGDDYATSDGTAVRDYIHVAAFLLSSFLSYPVGFF